MRQARFKIKGVGVYHCMSRTVAGAMLFDDPAKEVLRKMIWKTAAFCGVEVLAHCEMTNHFHILVRIDSGAARRLSRGELLRRYREFFSLGVSYGYPAPETLASFFEADGKEAELWEARLRARMGDVSEFLKTLKQRFTAWFNKTHRRYGTLWAERFKSVLVEDSPQALRTVSAYIDLNPVRAGLVESPEQYRWCSYSEALGGSRIGRAGILAVCGEVDWDRALSEYRLLVSPSRVIEPRSHPSEISGNATGNAASRALRVALRRRWAALTNGVIIGSGSFICRHARLDRRASERKMTGKSLFPEIARFDLATYRRSRESAPRAAAGPD